MPTGIYKRTEYHGQKISEAKKGKMPKNISQIAGWFKGKKFTTEHKKKLSEVWANKDGKRGFQKGNKINVGRPVSKETREKIGKANSVSLKGMKYPDRKKPPTFSEEHRRRLSESQAGDKSTFWKGGITPINALIRSSAKYKSWRMSVFVRDNFTCLWCGQIGGELNADHIKPFAYFPLLRFDLDNGRTLCVPCHRKTDTWGHKTVEIKRDLKKLLEYSLAKNK